MADIELPDCGAKATMGGTGAAVPVKGTTRSEAPVEETRVMDPDCAPVCMGAKTTEMEQDWPAGMGAGQLLEEALKLPVKLGLRLGAAPLMFLIVTVCAVLVVVTIVVVPKSRLAGKADKSGGATAESGTLRVVSPLLRAMLSVSLNGPTYSLVSTVTVTMQDC